MCIWCGTPAVWRAGMQVTAQRDGKVIDDAAAPAEAGHAELAGRELVPLENDRAVEHVGPQLGLVEIALQRPAVVVVARVATNREEAVGGEGHEALDRGAARHVF